MKAGRLTFFLNKDVMGIAPSARHVIVEERRWLSEKEFASVLGIGQILPGPNTMNAAVLIGWQLAGFGGLLVATLAIMAPSCILAFAAGRAIARWSERRWTRPLREGLIPLTLSLILASGLSMMRMADHDAITLIISLGTAAFVLTDAIRCGRLPRVPRRTS